MRKVLIIGATTLLLTRLLTLIPDCQTVEVKEPKFTSTSNQQTNVLGENGLVYFKYAYPLIETQYDVVVAPDPQLYGFNNQASLRCLNMAESQTPTRLWVV